MQAASLPYYRLDALQLYIPPGEELTVDLKNKISPSEAIFSGDEAAANQWLNQELLVTYRFSSQQYDDLLDTTSSYADYRQRLLAIVAGRHF